MTLDKLKPHESAKITAVGGSGALRHHLLDMGLTPQTEVTLQKVAPMGDPVQFELRGYELTLRLDEARKAFGFADTACRLRSSALHPGAGSIHSRAAQTAPDHPSERPSAA